MIRIILADDHDLFVEGLTSLLEADPELNLVHTAANGKEVLDFLETKEADLVLLDINMPVMDGVDTSKALLKKYPKVKIIMLTMYNKEFTIQQLLGMGVHGYLLKNTSKRELLTAIHSVMEGKKYFAPEITLKILQGQNRSTFNSNLTKRESEIAGYICQGFSSQKIADKLFVSKFTIDSHRKNILSKTECKNSVELVHWAQENNLIP